MKYDNNREWPAPFGEKQVSTGYGNICFFEIRKGDILASASRQKYQAGAENTCCELRHVASS